MKGAGILKVVFNWRLSKRVEKPRKTVIFHDLLRFYVFDMIVGNSC